MPNTSRISQAKDIAIIIAIIGFMLFNFRTVEPTIITDTKIVRDTITLTEVVTVPKVIIKTDVDTVYHFVDINNTIHDTIYKTIEVPAGYTLSADTVNFESGEQLRAYHVSQGSIRESRYNLDIVRDTIKVTTTKVLQPSRIYLLATASKGSFSPSIHMDAKKLSIGAGYDMVRKLPSLSIGYKIGEISRWRK